MRPPAIECDRCGGSLNATPSPWREGEFGAVSFAWTDCGCGKGTTAQAILTRAERTSEQWATAVLEYLVQQPAPVERTPYPGCKCVDCQPEEDAA